MGGLVTKNRTYLAAEGESPGNKGVKEKCSKTTSLGISSMAEKAV